MRLRGILYLILSLTIFYVSSSFSDSNASELTVRVTNIAYTDGYIEIGLYNSSKNFPKVGKTLRMKRVKPKGNTIEYKFENLSPGSYAVCVYHDKNADNKCNRNWFGIPTEAYAFSNDFRPMFSAPVFSDCAFWVSKTKEVSIKLVY